MNDLIPGVHTEGSVLIDGEDIFEMDPVNLRQRVGMVFQKPNPFPKSIYDNVAYGPRVNGLKDRKKLDEIVERSLRGAALWDEVKITSINPGWRSLAASSSAYALHAL